MVKKVSALTTRAGRRRRECRFSFVCDVRYEVPNSEKSDVLATSDTMRQVNRLASSLCIA
jgi:hypothetical protein